jgi:hypothetical protein
MLSRRFAELRRRIERRWPGSEIDYAGAVELTERGALHFHVVIRGTPFMAQAWLSSTAAAIGFGRILDVRQVRGGAIAGYLSKQLGGYLTKAAGSSSWPPHFRRIRFSREWAPDWVPRARSGRQDGAHVGGWLLLGIDPPETARAGQGRPQAGTVGADP